MTKTLWTMKKDRQTTYRKILFKSIGDFFLTSLITILKVFIYLWGKSKNLLKRARSFFQKIWINLYDHWTRCLSFLRRNAVIFVLLLLYISFYRYWESLIGDHVIDTFLRHFESNWINDGVFFIATIFCVVSTFFNWNKKNKQQIIIISIILICLWVYYRFLCDRCGGINSYYILRFTSLSLFGQIMYFDIIAIFAFCKLVSPLFHGLLIRKSNDKNSNGYGFIQDSPIDNKEDDILGRTQQAEKAADLLLRTDTKNGSFTMGINAPWGAGKTSFMNMMKEIIFSKKDDCIILDFNPWLYAAEKNLITVFFEELSKSLKRYDLSLSKNIIDYSTLLSAFDTQETKIVASIISMNQHEMSLQEKKTQITKAIKGLQRQIFVFIDDLDRLDADELLEMMKLIRNISDFPYMYYIAAYDKTYLVECLEKKMKTKEIDFTEKIFQVELQPLEGPKINLSIELYRMLKKYIENISDKQDFDVFINWARDDSLFLSMLSNIREVKRLANSFLISYNYLKGKVNVFDLLLFELFQMKYPLVFLHYTKHRAIFTEKVDSKIVNKIDFTQHLEAQKKELKITDSDIILINRLFDVLFPDSPIGESRKRICEIRFYDNYFVPQFSETAISLKDFNNLMKSNDIDTIQDMIVRWSHYKELSLIERLKKYNPSNKKELKTLIKVLFFTLYLNIDGFTGQEITDRILLLSSYNKKNDQSNREDLSFISNLLLERYSIQICQYLYSLINHYDGSFPLEKEMMLLMHSIRVEQFNKCIDMYPLNFKELIHSFIYMIDPDYWTSPVPNNDINSVIYKMKKHAENNMIAFVSSVIVQTGQDSDTRNSHYYFINKLPVLLWGNFDRFYDIIISTLHDNSNSINLEVKSFLKEYKNNGFNHTLFSFQHIKPLSLKFQDFFYQENIRDFDIWRVVLETNLSNNDKSQYSIRDQYDRNNQLKLLYDNRLKDLAVREVDLESDDINIATSYDVIGQIYMKNEYFTPAIEVFTNALKIRQRASVRDHLGIAMSYDNIGLAYYYKGFKDKDRKKCYYEALIHFKKALEILIPNYESDSFTKWVKYHSQKTEEVINGLKTRT